jgi:hypothetical protein
VQHKDELDEIIEAFMMQRSLDENLRFFEEAARTPRSTQK